MAGVVTLARKPVRPAVSIADNGSRTPRPGTTRRCAGNVRPAEILRLDRIGVQLRHAQRASGSDIKDRFERVIALDGQLSIEERQHLLAIAERCPVSQTLKRSSDITSLLAEEMPERAALSAA